MWLGTPTWFKASIVSGDGRAASDRRKFDLEKFRERAQNIFKSDLSFWDSDGKIEDRKEFVKKASSIREIIERLNTLSLTEGRGEKYDGIGSNVQLQNRPGKRHFILPRWNYYFFRV